jgi:hypothetical protein
MIKTFVFQPPADYRTCMMVGRQPPLYGEMSLRHQSSSSPLPVVAEEAEKEEMMWWSIQRWTRTATTTWPSAIDFTTDLTPAVKTWFIFYFSSISKFCL